MRQINYGVTLSLLLATTLLISGCSSFYKPEKEVVTVTKLIERQIPTVPHPKQVQMNDIRIYVVSPTENFEEFKKEFEAKNGADSYIAISIKDYDCVLFIPYHITLSTIVINKTIVAIPILLESFFCLFGCFICGAR